MTASVDGFIKDRSGSFEWTAPSDEVFGFHLERVRELGLLLCGRRLYETMLPWETDSSLRETELGAAFASVWSTLEKIVFSRTLTKVDGNARLATRSLAEEVALANDRTDKNIEIGGAELAGAAMVLGLVDELRIFRAPILLGGGTPLLPPVSGGTSLRLVNLKAFASGVVYEHYMWGPA